MDWNTLAGVALGASLAYVIQKRIRRDDSALNARLALTGTFRLLWGNTEYQVLRKHLHRVRVQLEDANVNKELIQELEAAAWICWRDSIAQAEKHYDPAVGHVGTVELHDAYEDTESRVHDALRGRWKLWRWRTD